MDALSLAGAALCKLARATKPSEKWGFDAWGNKLYWECARFVRAWTHGDAAGSTFRVVFSSVTLAVFIAQWSNHGAWWSPLAIIPFVLFAAIPMAAGGFLLMGLLVCPASYVAPVLKGLVWVQGLLVGMHPQVATWTLQWLTPSFNALKRLHQKLDAFSYENGFHCSFWDRGPDRVSYVRDIVFGAKPKER